MTIFNTLTFGIALIGAILGIINTWFAYDKDRRVKLRVVPKFAFPVGGAEYMYPEKMISIEVVNLNSFPVTISQIGFLLHGTKDRLVLTIPIIPDNKPFPRRLESRSSFAVYGMYPTEETREKYKKIRCAFAETECGIITTGNSPALKSILASL